MTEEPVENKLVGKTIVSAKRIKLYANSLGEPYTGEHFDDEPILRLLMSDGSVFEIIADYGGYTGSSEDEYPRFIKVKEKKHDGRI